MDQSTPTKLLEITAPVVQGTPKRGGVYMQRATTAFAQMDPHTSNGPGVWTMITERLLDMDPRTNELAPHIAASWELVDPLTMVFKIKPGVKIHNVPPWNGRDFNAEDVAFNLERITGATAAKEGIAKGLFARASTLGNFSKAVAVDPYTVRVTLTKPNSSFFNGLVDPKQQLMPKEIVDVGFKDPMKFGGVGPFQMQEYAQGQFSKFKRADNHFRPGEPFFDGTTVLIIDDVAAANAAFMSKQLHVVSITGPDIALVKKARPDALLYQIAANSWPHFRPHMQYQPFTDFRVRKALHLATDFADINDNVYGVGGGWAYMAGINAAFEEGWAPDRVKKLNGYNPDTKTQDRADAAKRLEAAGFPGGKGLDWSIIFSGPGQAPIRWQGQMASVFPDMKVKMAPLADSVQFNVRQSTDQFQMLSYGILGASDAVVESFQHYHTTGSRNYGKFTNPDNDRLLEKAVEEPNRKARTALMDEWQTKFHSEWMPMLVLCASPSAYVLDPSVGGFDKAWGPFSWTAMNTRAGRLYFVDK